jgi:CheY-like chemotaxis protein
LTALEAVHRAGFVHCDVNPSNVFLHWKSAENEVVKLLDFGISVPVGTRACDSGMGAAVGTLPFMAPEQLDESVLSPATDIYAVGAVLYAMVTGRAPFGDLGDREQAEAIRHGRPIPPSVLRPSCSPALEELILRALAREEFLRFTRAGDMRMAIARLADADDLPRGARAFGVPASVPPHSNAFAAARTTEPVGLRPEVHDPPAKERDESSNEGARSTVLVVEDDDVLRHDLAASLARVGCRVRTAANGFEGLESLRSNPLPQLVLMDLMMPIMDGWAFRRAMLADGRLSSVPVVVLSSVGGIEGETRRLEAAAHLTKPVHPQELLDAIIRQLSD